MNRSPLKSDEYTAVIRQFRLVAAVAALVLAAGTIFFHFTEKLSWLNAVYFCVITLTTVGYGDITPKTDAGKIFDIFYVLTGIGIIATLANLLVKRAMLRHRR